MPTLANVLIYSCIGLFTTYILHLPHRFITYILHRPHRWRWVALESALKLGGGQMARPGKVVCLFIYHSQYIMPCIDIR